MNLEEIKKIAEEYISLNKDKYSRIEIVGSIRRSKEECKDIDLVAIPLISTEKKILKEEFRGVQVEVYLTNEKNYEVIRLIRIGSKEFNRRLCFLAIKKGLSLKAGGEGLVDKSGKVISNTEKGIIENLLNKYVEPKER